MFYFCLITLKCLFFQQQCPVFNNYIHYAYLEIIFIIMVKIFSHDRTIKHKAQIIIMFVSFLYNLCECLLHTQKKSKTLNHKRNLLFIPNYYALLQRVRHTQQWSTRALYTPQSPSPISPHPLAFITGPTIQSYQLAFSH